MSDGRLSGQENSLSPTCQVFNDLPRLWFLGVSQKVSLTLFRYAADLLLGGR